MRGLEVPEEVILALGGGPRAPIVITINGHSWRSRLAKLRGRHLIGLSNANRRAAGVVTGDEIDVTVELDTEVRLVIEPAELTAALDLDPRARRAFDDLSTSRRREIVRVINAAKRPETRTKRINSVLSQLHDVPL